MGAVNMYRGQRGGWYYQEIVAGIATLWGPFLNRREIQRWLAAGRDNGADWRDKRRRADELRAGTH